MSGSFVERLINISFDLGSGSFGAGKPNRTTLSGLRVHASISHAGAPQSTAFVRIYGMTQVMMNQLTSLGMRYLNAGRQNEITIQAGDAGSGMATVFAGTIFNAWADHQSDPESMFYVFANSGRINALKPIPPGSYSGSADVATIMANLAAQMGLTLENTGVTAKLSNPYFPGTATMQVDSCARAAGISYFIDKAKNVLAIWPKGQARAGLIPVVSPQTGMIGYPTYTANGIAIRTTYNPAIQFGGKIKVQSAMQQANGEWGVFNLQHTLESKVPSGPWETQMEGVPPGLFGSGANGQ